LQSWWAGYLLCSPPSLWGRSQVVRAGSSRMKGTPRRSMDMKHVWILGLALPLGSPPSVRWNRWGSSWSRPRAPSR
jgi:hypothetical protein